MSKLENQWANAKPGGNWKDIPLSNSSKRLNKIKETGSRTTLYGDCITQPGILLHNLWITKWFKFDPKMKDDNYKRG